MLVWAVFIRAALAEGNPTPVGGSGRLADALIGLVTARGGDLICNADVCQLTARQRVLQA